MDNLDSKIIYYAITDRRYMIKLAKEIKPEYLDARYHLLYGTLLKLYKDPRINDVLSLPAILDYLESNLDTTAVTPQAIDPRPDVSRLYTEAQQLGISEYAPKHSDFNYYLTKLKDRYNRKIVTNSSRILYDMLENDEVNVSDVNKFIKKTMLQVNGIQKVNVFDEGTVGQDAPNMLSEYEQIERDPYLTRGVMVGYTHWDNISNGLQPSELTIIAGMEGSGKSVMMMNWAVNAWLGTNRPWSRKFETNGHNVLYFTLEMPRSNRGELTQAAYLNKRILSCVGEIDFNRLRSGKLTEDEKDDLKKTVSFMHAYDVVKKFYVVDIPRGATVEDLEAKYIEVEEEIGDKIDLVVVDYLGLMCGDEENDWQEQGEVAAKLHEFCRVYRVPVLTAAQMNRVKSDKGSLDGQKYNTGRLARSAQISQNANNVLMIETGDSELENEMIVHIVKFRDGRKQTLHFVKAFDRMKLYESSALGPQDRAVQRFEELR